MKLIVALDLGSREEIFTWAAKLKGLPLILKFGLRNLPQLVTTDIADLKKQGFQVFVDAKLHDIPTQVSAAVTTWGGLGADFVTVHLSGGRPMLVAAAEAARKVKVELFGVSVLTSMADSDLAELGVSSTSAEQVGRLVELGLKSGLHSFVCSVKEVPELRRRAKDAEKEIRFVCPGLHFEGQASAPDQKRSSTIQEAVAIGVELPVVGRAILSDAEPRAKVEKILKLLASVSSPA